MACKACRMCKTKCDLESTGAAACSRCTRLGLHCVPSGPSRRGQWHPNRKIAKLNASTRAFLVEGDPAYAFSMASTAKLPPKVSTALSAPCPLVPAAGLRVRHDAMCKMVRAMMGGWSTMSNEKNSFKLLRAMMAMAERCKIPVSALLGPAAGGELPLAEDLSRCPEPVVQLLGGGGLCVARSVIHDTAVAKAAGFVTNAAFRASVCDDAALCAAWRESGGKTNLFEHLVHAEDASVVADFLEAALVSCDVVSAGAKEDEVRRETSQRVRLRRSDGEYEACEARLLLLADGRMSWLAAQFLPLSPPCEPAKDSASTASGSTSSSLSVGVADRDTPNADPLGIDISLEELQMLVESPTPTRGVNSGRERVTADSPEPDKSPQGSARLSGVHDKSPQGSGRLSGSAVGWTEAELMETMQSVLSGRSEAN